MAGINLSGIAALVEGLIMLDTVRFTTPSSGKPVFNPTTGAYTYPEGDLIYEGIGAVQVAGTSDGVTADPSANLPWPGETRSRYRALTPLSAPIAARDTIVTVVAVHDDGDLTLLGRQWRALDPSVGGTLGVVRITGLDQITKTGQVT
jgi:hypothetical protein